MRAPHALTRPAPQQLTELARHLGRFLVCLYFLNLAWENVQLYRYYSEQYLTQPRAGASMPQAPAYPWATVLLVTPAAVACALGKRTRVAAGILTVDMLKEDTQMIYLGIVALLRDGMRPNELMVKKLSMFGCIALVFAGAVRDTRAGAAVAGMLTDDSKPQLASRRKSAVLLAGRLLMAALFVYVGLGQMSRIRSRSQLWQHRVDPTDGHDNSWLILELVLSLPFAAGYKTRPVTLALAATLAAEALTCWRFWHYRADAARGAWALGKYIHARSHFVTNLSVAGGLILLAVRCADLHACPRILTPPRRAWVRDATRWTIWCPKRRSEALRGGAALATRKLVRFASCFLPSNQLAPPKAVLRWSWQHVLTAFSALPGGMEPRDAAAPSLRAPPGASAASQPPAPKLRAVAAGSFYGAAAAAAMRPAGAPTAALHDPSAPGALVLSAVGDARFKPPAAAAVVVDPCISARLRPHQREGVAFLYECVMGLRGPHTGCLLCDDMGLGKTLQLVALLWTLLKQSPAGGGAVPAVRRALVVCPASLVATWRSEVRKWLGPTRLGVAAIGGGPKARAAFAAWAARGQTAQPLCITSYETLRACAAEAAAAAPGLLVCDEGHRLKSATGSKTLEALRALGAAKRVILSGCAPATFPPFAMLRLR